MKNSNIFMYTRTKQITLLFASFALASSASAVVTALTAADFTTAEGFVDGSDSAQTLASVQGSSTLQFATTTGATTGSNLLHGAAATAPANIDDALSDSRIDTGSVSTGVDEIYALSGLTGSDAVVFFFNGSASGPFYQGPGTIQAVDSAGTLIGSAVTLPGQNGAQLGELNLARVGSTPLNPRSIFGALVTVDEFGLADTSTIAGVQFAGVDSDSVAPNGDNPATLDFNLVAAVTPIPEPSSTLLSGLALLGLLARRRR